MPALITFTTPPFSVTSASVIDASSVRVTLTAAPNSFVPANFSIPTTTVTAATSDPSDANSIILSLTPGLSPNNYTVTCSGLTSGSPPVAMTAPFSAAFAVLVGPPVWIAPELAYPATNPSALSTLRSYIPSSMKGNVWTQLLATLGEEEQLAWDQAASVYDQLFLTSAEGQYLSARASEEGGYIRPELIGFTDDIFRDLVIQLSTRKLTINAFLRILEIYYGLDAVRANIRTTTAEPFNIPNGSTQIFNIDGIGPFTVTFNSAEFTSSVAVTAIEAAIAFNRSFDIIGAKALALPFVDTQTNLIYLTIYTSSRGLKGSIESISGPLPFPSGRKTVQTQSRSAYVKVTSSSDTVEVVLPATSIVVSREPGVNSANISDTFSTQILTAEFFNLLGGGTGFWGDDLIWGDETPWGGVYGNMILVTTNGSHGMIAGQEVFIDGLLAPLNAGVPFAINGLFKIFSVPSPSSFIVNAT